MPTRKRSAALKLGERARSKVNRRVGTVDAVDGDREHGSTGSTMTSSRRTATSPPATMAPGFPELIEREEWRAQALKWIVPRPFGRGTRVLTVKTISQE